MVATSNVESVALGVIGSFVASLVYLLLFRWWTRPRIAVTASANGGGTELVVANTSRRAIFDIQVNAAAVMLEGAMGTIYKSTRPLALSAKTIAVLLGVRRAQKVVMAYGRRPIVDASPASQSTIQVEPCEVGEVLWVTVSGVDSVSGVRRAVSAFPLGAAAQ